ncbi:phage tail tip fiber protein [Variovorax sp.]|uniref:phage tail tip fiber protein n=1 Tax=Variovorax sp. TaxID=1871043 RepID=UPI003BA932F4
MARLIRFALLGLALLALPLVASADPITSILSTVVYGSAAAGTAVTLGAAIAYVATAVSVISSVYGSVQARKQAKALAERRFQQEVASLQDRTATILASDDSWVTVYGQPAPIGGSVKAVLGSGDKAQFKHIVIVFAAHECEAIDDVFIDGESLQLDDFGTSRNPSYQLEYGVSRDVEVDFTVERFAVVNPYTEEVTYTYAALVNTSSLGQIYDPRLVAIRKDDGTDLMGKFTVVNPNSIPGQMHYPGIALLSDQTVEGFTGKVTVRVDGAGSALHVSKHLSRGGVDVADPILMNALPDYWTADHKLSGFTYIVATLNLLLERFQGGPPNFTAKIRGKRIYDPRTGQTVYTRNPALCLADFLRSECGYLALDAQIEQNTLVASANACDGVAYGAEAWGDTPTYGNDTRLYVCDGVFRSDQDRDTTRQQLEDAMAGFSLESGGVWRILAGAWTTPVLALTEDDMLGPSAVVQTANPGQSRYNGARGVYVNQARNGVSEDIVPYVNAAFRAADEKDKFLDLPLTFTASHARAHQLARVRVEQSRGGFVLQIHPKMLAWHLQPGDRIVYSNELYGFENKTFRVQEWTFSQKSPLALQIVEDEESFYDLADEVRADPAPNTNLPSPLLVPDAPFDVTVRSGPEEMVLQGGTMVVRAHVRWALSNSPAVRMGGAVRVQWRTVVPVGEWQTLDLPGDAVEAFILGLGVSTEYQVRVRFQTAYVQSSWVTIDHTVTGKGELPANVDGLALAITSAGIVASWNPPAGLDLLDWSTTSVRIGATWELGEEVFSAKATSAALGWRQAGTLRVWASHGSTSGEWSVPVVASIQIDAPLQPVVSAEVARNNLTLAWQDCKATQPLAFYLVSRGPALEGSEEVARSTDRQLARVEAPGTRRYWVRAVDVAGNAGPAGYVQATVLPSIDQAIEELEQGLQETVDELKHADALQIAALDQEAQNRAAALLNEAANRAAEISQAAATLAATVDAEAQARQAADIAEAQLRQQQASINAAAIAQEISDRAAALVDARNASDAKFAQEALDRIAAVAAEAARRTADIAQEQAARAGALIAEADARGTEISNEATRRLQDDLALASQLATLTAVQGDAAAALQDERTTRATDDQAEAIARQQLATQLQGVDATLAASIAQEATTRSSEDQAEAQRRETLSVTLTGMKAPSATLQDVRGASARFRFAAGVAAVLQVWQVPSLANAGGLIAQERDARVDSIAAEVSERQTLQAQLTGGYKGSNLEEVSTGLIAQEKIARVTQGEALAQQMMLISAGVGEQFDPSRIWYFDSGVEDWSGNGVPAAAGGWLRPAAHASDPFVTSPAGLASAGSTYSQVRIRVRKVGSPTWGGEIFWRATSDAGFAGARSAALAEPAYDGAGIGMITVNPGWSGTVDQIRIDLSAAQTSTDYFEIDWVALGRPSPGASTAALQSEIATRAAADAAQGTAREQLAAQMRGDYTGNSLGALTSGLIAQERDTRVTAVAAEASQREQLSATVATNKADADARFAAETLLRSNADEAEAIQRQALGATLTGQISAVSANLVDERQVRAEADNAQVSAQQALAAQLRGGYGGTDASQVSSGLIYSERLLRIAADSAEAAERQQLATEVINNKAQAEAGLLQEATARSNADQAAAQQLEQLSATMTTELGQANAAVQQEAATRATADTAEATQRRGLSVALLGAADVSGTLATVVGPSLRLALTRGAAGPYLAWVKPTAETLASGLLQEEIQARITAVSAEVAQRQALSTRVDTGLADAEADVTAERVARTNADAAEAAERATLAAQLRGGYGGTDASQVSSGLIYSERLLRIAADSAEAAERQALSVRIENGLALADAKLAEEKQVRADADTAQVSAQQALMAQVRGSYGGTDASQVSSGLIYSERQLRIAGDNAEASERQQLATEVVNNKALAAAGLVQEATARSNADEAAAQQLAALSATVVGNKSAGDAAIAGEASTRATADQAEANLRQALSSAIVGGTDIAIRLADVVGASMRLAFSAPQAKLGVWLPPSLAGLSAGLIAEERSTRAAADEANAQAITSVSARLSTAEGGLVGQAGAISALSTSVASIDGQLVAQGSAISGLTASVGDNAVAITNTTTALVALDGRFKASWRLNADVNGKVSGLVLDNDGSTSNFVVLADKFAWAASINGEVKFPVVFGTVGGQASFGFTGSMFLDGVLKTRMLDAEAVTADKIAAGAVTAEKISVNNLQAVSARTGDLVVDQLRTGGFTSYNWPQAGQGGVFLSDLGLLIGNARDRGFFQVEAQTGNVYSNNFQIVNGKLTISQVDVIETFNIRGGAVSVTQMSSASDLTGINNGGNFTSLTVWGFDAGAATKVQIHISADASYGLNVRLYRSGVLVLQQLMSNSLMASIDVPAGGADYSLFFNVTRATGADTIGHRAISLTTLKR